MATAYYSVRCFDLEIPAVGYHCLCLRLQQMFAELRQFPRLLLAHEMSSYVFMEALSSEATVNAPVDVSAHP